MFHDLHFLDIARLVSLQLSKNETAPANEMRITMSLRFLLGPRLLVNPQGLSQLPVSLMQAPQGHMSTPAPEIGSVTLMSRHLKKILNCAMI